MLTINFVKAQFISGDQSYACLNLRNSVMLVLAQVIDCRVCSFIPRSIGQSTTSLFGTTNMDVGHSID